MKRYRIYKVHNKYYYLYDTSTTYISAGKSDFHFILDMTIELLKTNDDLYYKPLRRHSASPYVKTKGVLIAEFTTIKDFYNHYPELRI